MMMMMMVMMMMMMVMMMMVLSRWVLALKSKKRLDGRKNTRTKQYVRRSTSTQGIGTDELWYTIPYHVVRIPEKKGT